ncbi:MAG: DNA polymerase III subunit chi [Aestuariivita sp.]|nr:DNA polymerase III subunit chi [Aestuariivita sp.]MCY4203867.1 DNA polymerase III subunit chi [Aestuariivita sp.]
MSETNTMGVAYFYRITRSSLAGALRQLLKKSLAQKWRVAVRFVEQSQVDQIDRSLWEVPEDSFLPHGLAGELHESAQPVVLTTSTAGNSPDCLICVNGAGFEIDEAKDLSRVCMLFEANNDEAISQSRRQWKTLTDSGCAVQYWTEEKGGWTMKVEA